MHFLDASSLSENLSAMQLQIPRLGAVDILGELSRGNQFFRHDGRCERVQLSLPTSNSIQEVN